MASLPLVGEELAGYQLRSVLGRGGMSVVYQAENPRLGSVVALKVLTPELAADDVFRARFLQESRIAARLNHPNVIPIYDMGQHDGLLYLAMRYVAGSDLRAVLKEQGRIAPAQALLLTGQTARALDAAHRQGLVHRDVKPANILVEPAGDEGDPDHVYLADFGITKHAASHSGLTATGEFIGTIDYVAPEQIRGQAVDARTDVYSLACVLYECLTGRVPFVKDLDAAVIWAHVEEPPTPPSTLRPELPRELDDVIMRGLAKDPADRYPTCRDLTEAARTAFGAAPGPLTGPSTVLRARPPSTDPAPRDQYRYAPPPPGTGAGAPARAGAGSGAGAWAVASAGPTAGARAGIPAASGGGPFPSPVAAPPGGSPSRRRALIAAIAAVAVILAGTGVGVWWFAGRGSGKPMAHMTVHHPLSPLQRALANANQSTDAKGKLPPRSCHATSATLVNCTSPTFAVNMVTFRTYPSLKALYAAYVTEIKSLGDKPLHTNYGNCSAVESSGEVGWNHNFRHTRRYSIPAMSAGMVSDNLAAGRAFCTETNAGFQMVWTQNSGFMMAIMMGGPHPDAWSWWLAVHHNIAFPGAKPMHM